MIPYKPRMVVLGEWHERDFGRRQDARRSGRRLQSLCRESPGKAWRIQRSPSGRWLLPSKPRAISGSQSKANELVKAYIATGKNMVYVDVATSTLSPDGKPRADLYEADGMDFDAKGFEVSAKLPFGGTLE